LSSEQPQEGADLLWRQLTDEMHPVRAAELTHSYFQRLAEPAVTHQGNAGDA
jgi:hypothetical protein